MANFPALRPATVQITPGTVPTTLTAGYDGSTTTSTADLVPTGDVLDMTFEGITEAEARGVVDHQDGEEGRAFQFTSTTLATGLTPAGYRWTYAQPISQDDIRAVAGSEFYRLSIRFLGVRVRRSSTPSATATSVPGGQGSAILNPICYGNAATPNHGRQGAAGRHPLGIRHPAPHHYRSGHGNWHAGTISVSAAANHPSKRQGSDWGRSVF